MRQRQDVHQGERSPAMEYIDEIGQQSSTSASVRQRQLEWDDRNHWSVVTQLHGSVWPRVLPLCSFNVVVCFTLHFLHRIEHPLVEYLEASKIASTGHRYLAMVMSLLLVSRVKITYDRYMKQSTALQQCVRTIHELVVTACLITSADSSRKGKLWRYNLCSKAIHLLSITMQVLEFRSQLDAVMMSNDYKNSKDLHRLLSIPSHLAGFLDQQQPLQQQQEQTPMQLLQQACRVPITHAYELRRTLLQHRSHPTEHLNNEAVWRHPFNEERAMFNFIDNFVKAISQLNIYMLTPLPFPLVQATKTLLLVWLVTLPFVFQVNTTSHLVVNMAMIVLITYGFAGLEVVAMELTDCFGDDPSDLDLTGHAYRCYEDCYTAILEIDGPEPAQQLRRTVAENSIFTIKEEEQQG